MPMHIMNGEIFTERKKGFEGSVTVAGTLSSSVNVVSHAGMAEAKKRGWPLASAAHSTSQG